MQDSGNGLNGNGGFTLVDEAGGETAVGGQHGGQQQQGMSSIGRKLQTTAELFDVISGNGEVRFHKMTVILSGIHIVYRVSHLLVDWVGLT